MEQNIEALVTYTDVNIAYVAFATIVATLRQALGRPLTQLQYLLFRFFVEVGLIHVVVGLVTISLITVLENELLAWRIATIAIVIAVSLYLVYYLNRRRKIAVKMPFSSRVVAIGYICFVPFMIVTALGLFWAPSLGTTLAYLTWAIASNIVVFVQFLGTFVEVSDEHV